MSWQWFPLATGFLLSLLMTQPCMASDSKQPEFDSWHKSRNSPAMMLVHSWYDDKCCHDKDCHPVPCEEIEKISDGWLWRDVATKQRHWFPHDRLKASHDDACQVCVSPLTNPSGICLYMPLPA